MHYLKSQIRAHALKYGVLYLVFIVGIAVALAVSPKAVLSSRTVQNATQFNDFLASGEKYFTLDIEDAIFTGYYFLNDADDEKSPIVGLGYVVPVDNVYIPIIMPSAGITEDKIEGLPSNYGTFKGKCKLSVDDVYNQFPAIVMRDFIEQSQLSEEMVKQLVYPLVLEPIGTDIYLEIALLSVLSIMLIVFLIKFILIVLKSIGILEHPAMRQFAALGENDLVSAKIDEAFSTDIVYENSSAAMTNQWLIGKRTDVSLVRLEDVENTEISGSYKSGYSAYITTRDGVRNAIKFNTIEGAQKLVEQIELHARMPLIPRVFTREDAREVEHCGTYNPNTVYETHMAHIRQMGMSPINSNTFHQYIFKNFEEQLSCENCYELLLYELGNEVDEGVPMSNDVYSFNNDCVVDEETYEMMLHNFVRITKNIFSISEVRADLCAEEEDPGYIEFKTRGQKCTYNITVDGNRFDHGFITFLNKCMKDSYITRNFYISKVGQHSTVIFTDEMSAQKISEHTEIHFEIV